MKNFIALGLAVGITVVGVWFLKGSHDAKMAAIQAEASRQTASAFAAAASATDQYQAQEQASQATSTVSPDPVNVAPIPTVMPPENKKITGATLHTNRGDISIEFFDSDAPNTVANFIKLAKAGFYNGTKFHRVIKSFMIQGGDPFSKDDSKQAQWGMGGPGYAFADEIRANNHNDAGTIAMANSGPNTNGSQFFINVNNNNFLDTKHTVFGKVTAGVNVAQAIENTATDSSDRPLEPVIITSVDLQ